MGLGDRVIGLVAMYQWMLCVVHQQLSMFSQ